MQVLELQQILVYFLLSFSIYLFIFNHYFIILLYNIANNYTSTQNKSQAMGSNYYHYNKEIHINL